MLYLVVRFNRPQNRPRRIIGAQTSELLHQGRIYRTPSQMPVEFLLDTGYGSEKCQGRVDQRQPTHTLEGAQLTSKRSLHQYSNPPEFSNTRSVLKCSFEDACLVEMPAHQK